MDPRRDIDRATKAYLAAKDSRAAILADMHANSILACTPEEAILTPLKERLAAHLRDALQFIPFSAKLTIRDEDTSFFEEIINLYDLVKTLLTAEQNLQLQTLIADTARNICTQNPHHPNHHLYLMAPAEVMRDSTERTVYLYEDGDEFKYCVKGKEFPITVPSDERKDFKEKFAAHAASCYPIFEEESETLTRIFAITKLVCRQFNVADATPAPSLDSVPSDNYWDADTKPSVWAKKCPSYLTRSPQFCYYETMIVAARQLKAYGSNPLDSSVADSVLHSTLGRLPVLYCDNKNLIAKRNLMNFVRTYADALDFNAPCFLSLATISTLYTEAFKAEWSIKGDPTNEELANTQQLELYHDTQTETIVAIIKNAYVDYLLKEAGHSARAHRNLAHAIALVNTAIQILPDHVQAHITLGEIHMGSNPRKAVDCFLRAFSLFELLDNNNLEWRPETHPHLSARQRAGIVALLALARRGGPGVAQLPLELLFLTFEFANAIEILKPHFVPVTGLMFNLKQSYRGLTLVETTPEECAANFSAYANILCGLTDEDRRQAVTERYANSLCESSAYDIEEAVSRHLHYPSRQQLANEWFCLLLEPSVQLMVTEAETIRIYHLLTCELDQCMESYVEAKERFLESLWPQGLGNTSPDCRSQVAAHAFIGELARAIHRSPWDQTQSIEEIYKKCADLMKALKADCEKLKIKSAVPELAKLSLFWLGTTKRQALEEWIVALRRYVGPMPSMEIVRDALMSRMSVRTAAGVRPALCVIDDAEREAGARSEDVAGVGAALALLGLNARRGQLPAAAGADSAPTPARKEQKRR